MKVILQKGRAKPFFARHPWVFAGAISRVVGDPEPGSEVTVETHEGQFVARGLWNPHSQIRVRLYSWSESVALDEAFFHQRLESAIGFRENVLRLTGVRTACRLVFSEADGLSGCIVDRFGEYLVVQFTALAMAQRRDAITAYLMKRLKPRGIYLRTERDIGELEGLKLEDQLLTGEVPDAPIEIVEGDLSFWVNLRVGQKTGFFLDQSLNRQAVAGWARDKTVFDGFCYSGGFGLHAARAGARSVLGIDVSESALGLARANADKNRLAQIRFEKQDVFSAMEQRVNAGEKFGMVVLDPPKFARSRQGVVEALRGYQRLLERALTLLEPDGILVFCCCSGRISMEAIDETLAQAANNVGREVQVFERRGAAPDHPVAVSCPESNYLKCLVGRAI